MEFSGAVDLNSRVSGIKFRNRESGQESFVVVVDKFPSMDDVHVEGRRVVEVSVELFVQMMAREGFGVVNPLTDAFVEEAKGE